MYFAPSWCGIRCQCCAGGTGAATEKLMQAVAVLLESSPDRRIIFAAKNQAQEKQDARKKSV